MQRNKSFSCQWMSIRCDRRLNPREALKFEGIYSFIVIVTQWKQQPPSESMGLELWPPQTVPGVTTVPPAPPAVPPTPVQWGPSTMAPNSRLPAPVSPVPRASTVTLQVRTFSRYLSGISRCKMNIPVFKHVLYMLPSENETIWKTLKIKPEFEIFIQKKKFEKHF